MKNQSQAPLDFSRGSARSSTAATATAADANFMDQSQDDDFFFPANQLGLLDLADEAALFDDDNFSSLPSSSKSKRRVAPTQVSRVPPLSPRAKKMRQGVAEKEVESDSIGFEKEVKAASEILKRRARSVSDILKTGGSLDLAAPEVVKPRPTSVTDSGHAVIPRSPPPPTSQPPTTDPSSSSQVRTPTQAGPSTQTSSATNSSKWVVLHDENLQHQGMISFSPGISKPIEKPNLSWDVGNQTYKVVLGHNTVFKKVEEGRNENGETKNAPFRVIRLENRYRPNNFSYVEFPARYISLLIDGLLKAEGVYIEENRIERERKNLLEEEIEMRRRERNFN